MRTLWLGLALLPYVALAGVDTWMHERARRVPRIEQLLHLGLALSLLGFLWGVFAARTMLAVCALAVFVVLLCVDAFGYHAHLDARERKVHFASYIALSLFVLTWQLLGAGP